MIIYSTKIDIEKCKNRIDAIIMSERYLADGLRGEVDFDRSTFYIRKIKPNFRSVCIRNLHCELIKKENKTIIKGEFRMDFVAEIIMGLWFGILAFIWIIVLICYLSNHFLGTSIEFTSGFSGGLIGPPIMVLLGALIIGASIEMYEYEENYVLEFIKSMLEAREIDT